jgi:methyl-accepting chemotaxis protein
MSFTRRILLSLAVPALIVLLFAAAIAASRVALERGFAAYFAGPDALAEAGVEMYAQGLQMELAVRNIVLNPGQATAFKNFDTAAAEFDAAHERARAAGAEPDLVTRLAQMRATLAQKQKDALELAKANPAAAADFVNREETPAWRTLRAELLDLKKGSFAAKLDANRRAQETIRLAALVAVGVALAGAALCAYNGWALRRRVMREIGGEPATVRSVLARIEHGDLSVPSPLARGDQHSLLAAVDRMQQSLKDMIAQVGRISTAVSTAAGEVASGSSDLSTRTERQAASLQQTAASLEELTTAVQQNSASADEATRLALQAHDVAQRGGTAVQHMIGTMSAISGQSQKIAEITSVIDSLAFQTNILALNASVESARAGEHGRGFAVVAAEVRALAQRCATAAREIKTLVAENVERVDTGSQQVEGAGKTMQDMVTHVGMVNVLIKEIASATREQSDGLRQINQAVAQLDDVTQQNAAMVEESTAASAQLHQHAGQLTQLAVAFRV